MMVVKIARGAFLAALALMIVSYAITVTSSKPVDQEQQPPIDRMYS